MASAIEVKEADPGLPGLRLGRAHTARKLSLHPVLIHVSGIGDIGHVFLSNVSVTFSENSFGVGCELPAPIVWLLAIFRGAVPLQFSTGSN